jgi:hypothetical protein
VGKTRDGVILYYDDGSGEPQCTVITSQQGPLKGKRLVRGCEADGAPYDQKQQDQPPLPLQNALWSRSWRDWSRSAEILGLSRVASWHVPLRARIYGG